MKLVFKIEMDEKMEKKLEKMLKNEETLSNITINLVVNDEKVSAVKETKTVSRTNDVANDPVEAIRNAVACDIEDLAIL